MAEETKTEMTEDQMFSKKLAEPKKTGLKFVGIENGLYTCFIEDVKIPKRKESFYKEEVEKKQKKVIDEYQKKETTWTEKEFQEKLDFVTKSVSTHEFKWTCLIVDDKEGKPEENGTKTTVRGQKIYPTANYVDTKLDQAKIVKLIKYLEGDDYKFDDFEVVKNWVGKYAQLQVVNSVGGYPKATFVGRFLKGEDLEMAKSKHEKTKAYIAESIKEKDNEGEKSPSAPELPSEHFFGSDPNMRQSKDYVTKYSLTKVNHVIANNIIDSARIFWDRYHKPIGISELVIEYPTYGIAAIRRTLEELADQGAFARQKDDKYLLAEIAQ